MYFRVYNSAGIFWFWDKFNLIDFYLCYNINSTLFRHIPLHSIRSLVHVNLSSGIYRVLGYKTPYLSVMVHMGLGPFSIHACFFCIHTCMASAFGYIETSSCTLLPPPHAPSYFLPMYPPSSFPCTLLPPPHAPSYLLPMYPPTSSQCTLLPPSHAPSYLLLMHPPSSFPCTLLPPPHAPSYLLPMYPPTSSQCTLLPPPHAPSYLLPMYPPTSFPCTPLASFPYMHAPP